MSRLCSANELHARQFFPCFELYDRWSLRESNPPPPACHAGVHPSTPKPRTMARLGSSRDPGAGIGPCWPDWWPDAIPDGPECLDPESNRNLWCFKPALVPHELSRRGSGVAESNHLVPGYEPSRDYDVNFRCAYQPPTRISRKQRKTNWGVRRDSNPATAATTTRCLDHFGFVHTPLDGIEPTSTCADNAASTQWTSRAHFGGPAGSTRFSHLEVKSTRFSRPATNFSSE